MERAERATSGSAPGGGTPTKRGSMERAASNGTTLWEMWKKGFDVWEDATARFLEQVLRSPLVLEPAGAALTAVLKAKVARDKAVASAWAAIGLPTRRDQERILHALNQLQSRILDLE